MRGLYLVALCTVAACGGTPTGADTGALSGDYRIAGAPNAGPWTFRVISQDDDRIIFDWIAGPMAGALPVRDTAEWNVSAYRVDWRSATNSPLYIARIVGTSCTGQTFYDFGNSPPWPSCTMSRP